MITSVPRLTPFFWDSLSSAPHQLLCARQSSLNNGENNRLRTPVARFLFDMKLHYRSALWADKACARDKRVSQFPLLPSLGFVRILHNNRPLLISDNIQTKRKYGLTRPKLPHIFA